LYFATGNLLVVNVPIIGWVDRCVCTVFAAALSLRDEAAGPLEAFRLLFTEDVLRRLTVGTAVCKLCGLIAMAISPSSAGAAGMDAAALIAVVANFSFFVFLFVGFANPLPLLLAIRLSDRLCTTRKGFSVV
jgi:hypothetical protein